MAATILSRAHSTGSLPISPDHDIWHQQAPAEIRTGYQSLEDETAWRLWVKHLRLRPRPTLLRKILPGKQRCLLLGSADEDGAIDAATNQQTTIEALCGLGKHESGDLLAQANAWLDRPIASFGESHQAEHTGHDSGHVTNGHSVNGFSNADFSLAQLTTTDALTALAWCHALPRLASHLPGPVWWHVLGRLIDLNALATRAEPMHNPLVWQLLAGELPLSLAYLLPELQACDDWRRTGQQSIDDGLEELISPQGVPHADQLAILPELVACWTRSSVLLQAMTLQAVTSPQWSLPTKQAFGRAVLALARFSRRDYGGEWAVAWGGSVRKKLLKAAARASGKPKCVAGVNAAIGKPNGDQLPGCSLNSERAQVAMLRTSWRPGAASLALTYAHRQVRVELSCTAPLISGHWNIELVRDRQPLSIESGWEEICAESDDDTDYIELEAKFTAGVKVQRQMLLVKQDGLLFVADGVLADAPAPLDYCGILPLADGALWQPCMETAEGRLIGGGLRRAQVLPLGLGEWRTDRRLGTLTQTGRGLELRQSGQGPCLYAPLLIDLKAKRIDKPLTWRQLTVAQQRNIVPAGEAVGYRAQIGKRQWFIYRSLTKPEVRAALGQNLNQEFLFARFAAETGETEMLLEVE